jgi:predicted ATP-binding protein involved in virulence
MSQDTFITEIKINKVRHLKDFTISLGKEKKHLILTGKNGSGKTSVLEGLNNIIIYLLSSNIKDINQYNLAVIFNDDSFFPNMRYMPIRVNFVYAFFQAKRETKLIEPKGIKQFKIVSNKIDNLNHNFLQYIVNLKAERSFANDDNEIEAVRKIDTWFHNFESMLKQIFNDDDLYIKFDRKNYNFFIHRKSREPFDFNDLSAGYSAIVDIITELILKIENTESKSFDCEGIVLIDEVENHLHVELQKDILPMLTSFFPNIQFIVTTHSPFVLSSLENSVIYDLERKELTDGNRFVNGGYSQIVKNYFEVDSEYSHTLEENIKRYEALINLFESGNISLEDEKELSKLDRELDDMALMLSTNIYLRFKALQKRIME